MHFLSDSLGGPEARLLAARPGTTGDRPAWAAGPSLLLEGATGLVGLCSPAGQVGSLFQGGF